MRLLPAAAFLLAAPLAAQPAGDLATLSTEPLLPPRTERCLTAASAAPGTPLTTDRCEPSAAQWFVLAPLPSGASHLRVHADDLCARAEGEPPSQIVLAPCDPRDLHQQWAWTETGALSNRPWGTCIAPRAGAARNGEPVETERCDGSRWQWSRRAVERPAAPEPDEGLPLAEMSAPQLREVALRADDQAADADRRAAEARTEAEAHPHRRDALLREADVHSARADRFRQRADRARRLAARAGS